jgi:hypothetical protein
MALRVGGSVSALRKVVAFIAQPFLAHGRWVEHPQGNQERTVITLHPHSSLTFEKP